MQKKLIYFLVIFTALVSAVTLAGNTTLRSVNTYFSLETDKNLDIVGAMFIFYISFVDALFPTKDPIFHISINPFDNEKNVMTCFTLSPNRIEDTSRTYSNVHIFGVHLETRGVYNIIAIPRRRNGTDFVNMHKAVKNDRLMLVVTVQSLNTSYDKQCDVIGQIVVDDQPLQTAFAPIFRSSMTQSTKIRSVLHNCTSWQSWRPAWTIDKLYQRFILEKSQVVECMNPHNIRKVRITDYTSQIIPVPVPGPSGESEFTIQQFTIPPGMYRICNTISNKEKQVRHCIFLLVIYDEHSCKLYMDAIRIHMTPHEEDFMWIMQDLLLNITQYYSIFAVYDLGYTGMLDYRIQWTCSGDVLCIYLQRRSKGIDFAVNQNVDIKLFDIGTKLQIPVAYMTAGTTVSLKVTVEYHHPVYTDFMCSGTAQRKITFISSAHGGIGIRCYRNCWHYLTPGTSLLVGIECDGCTITRANNPQISWSISSLIQPTMVGQNTAYLTVTHFGSTPPSEFMVLLAVSYTANSGLYETFRIAKRFCFHKSQPGDSDTRVNHFTESQKNVMIKPGNLATNFLRYDLYETTSPNTNLRLPVLTRITQLSEKATASTNNTPKVEGICKTHCTATLGSPINSGNYPHCTDCSKYVTCAHGQYFERPCPKDTVYDYILQICTSDVNKCIIEFVATNPTTDTRDLLILQTIWSTVDVCIESFKENDVNASSIQIDVFVAHDLRPVSTSNNVYDVPRSVDVLQPDTDFEKLFLFTQEDPNFLVNDQTHIVTIARAIQIVATWDGSIKIPVTVATVITTPTESETTGVERETAQSTDTKDTTGISMITVTEIDTTTVTEIETTTVKYIDTTTATDINTTTVTDIDTTTVTDIDTTNNTYIDTTNNTYIDVIIAKDIDVINAKDIDVTNNTDIDEYNDTGIIGNSSVTTVVHLEVHHTDLVTLNPIQPTLEDTNFRLSRVVDMILDSMISKKDTTLTYSNINIYIVSLIRMLSIRFYTAGILDKAITVLVNVHDLHYAILNDPSMDEALHRVKLDAIEALTLYLLGFRREYPQDNKNKEFETALLEVTYAIVSNMPDRMAQGHAKSYKENNFAAEIFWLNPLEVYDDLSITLNSVMLTISINVLKMSSAFSYSLNPFINVAIFSSVQSALPSTIPGKPHNVPMLFINISMKQPSLPRLDLESPGLYNIRYEFDIQSYTGSHMILPLGIYAHKSTKSHISGSDCYLIRVSASTRYATILVIKPESQVTVGVRVHLANTISAGLTVMTSNEILLTENPASTQCNGIATRPYSVFLPALTLRQRSEIKGSANYYLMIRVPPYQTYASKVSKPGPYNSIEIGQERINLTCLQTSCVTVEKRNMETKDCQVDRCSGGKPSYITCQCDRGNTFTARVQSCDVRFVNTESLQVEDIDMSKISFMIPTLIISIWFVFFALIVIARRLDLRERRLGKTLALEGIFCPAKEEHYLMCFVTGFGRNCSTKSVPYMTIIGTESVSSRYMLTSSDHLFMNGSEIWLLVSVPENLGKPRRVILSLEPEYSEMIDEWFVKELYMRHISSGHEWSCPFNSWIPDKSNFDFRFLVEDATKKRGTAQTIFASTFLRLLRNHHPVVGIICSVPGSSFSKVQHVVFCFCCIFILMWVCVRTQNLPSLKLTQDEVIKKEFSLNIEFYSRAAICAIIVIIPIYFMCILLETARPVDSNTIEWQHAVTRRHLRSSVSGSNDPGSRLEHVAIENKLYIRSPSPKKSVDDDMNTNSDDDVICNKTRDSEETIQSGSTIWSHPAVSKLHLLFNKIFPLPVLFCLAVMTVINVSISYYIMVLGLFFTTDKSLEYMYIVCVAFLILIVVVYPVLLIVVAIINVGLYISGKTYYGITTDSIQRSENITSILSECTIMLLLDVLERRRGSVGSAERHKVKDVTVQRSHNWCKQLMIRKRAIRRKFHHYSSFETILFIIVSLLIINAQTGSVFHGFLQTTFMATSLNVHRITDDPQVAITTDEIWEHLEHVFSAINSWKSNRSIVAMNIMSAVRVRQIRVKSYEGNCEQDFPDLLSPRCLSDVEKSVFEDRTFANSWEVPVSARFTESGPFSYSKTEDSADVSTATHRYPARGYDATLSRWSSVAGTIDFLKMNKWVDDMTRAVVLSINFINVDSGLSTIVQHVYELSMAGFFMYTPSMYTFPMKLSQSHEIIMSAMILIFALMTVYFLIFEIKGVFEMGFVNYFKYSQSWFLLTERCLSFCVLYLYLRLQSDIKQKLHQVQEAYINELDDTTFIDFEGISKTKLDLILISCLLIVTCLIKLLMDFRDYALMATFVNMIPASFKLSIIPIFVIIPFGFLGCLIFQSSLIYYRDVFSASVTVTVLMLETSPLVPTSQAQFYIGKLYILNLYCVMFYIILNYFMVLLNEAYSDFKRQSRLLHMKTL